jgi:hypothetical protein
MENDRPAIEETTPIAEKLEDFNPDKVQLTHQPYRDEGDDPDDSPFEDDHY